MASLKVAVSVFSLVSCAWATDHLSLIQRTKRLVDDATLAEAGDPLGRNKAVMTQFMTAMAAARVATRLAAGPTSFVDGGGSQQKNEKINVMYGVFTTSVPAYRKKLEAVMDTWGARPKSNGLFYSVAGRTYPSEWQEPGVIVGAEDCADGSVGNSCKEASLIAEAARRNVSWLVITGEDNYVDTGRVEAALRAMDPTKPVAMGCLGCGIRLAEYGALVAKQGGLCGGCGEVLSQGALQMLAARGRSALIKEYGPQTQCDMATSRALLERSIPLSSFPGELLGNPMMSQKEMEQATGVMVFHYILPPTMRWLHVLRTGSAQDKDAQLPSLEAAAFKEGCARGFANNQWFGPKVQECRKNLANSAR